MSAKLELESLLSSKVQYDNSISTLLTSIERARDRNQIIKNIILFCKNSLSITSKPIMKYLVMKLINDIIGLVGFEEVAPYIEANILKKVLDTCIGDKRSRITTLNEEDKKWYEEFIKIAIQSVYFWGSSSNNRKSNFFKATQQLKEKEIESSAQLRPYVNQSVIENRSSSKNQRKSTRSVSYQDNETILKLIDTFQNVEIYVGDEFKKSERNNNYKIKITEILQMLDQLIREFKNTSANIRKGTEYTKLLEYISIAEEFMSRFEGKKQLTDKQIRRNIEDTFFDRQNIQTEASKKKALSPEDIQLKKLDIFQILQNIHRRIENEQKALGVFGNYQMKNVLIDDEDKREHSTQKGRISNEATVNRFQ